MIREKIYFYSTKDYYGPFSNFSKHSFIVDSVKYKTSEHYFQAAKFLDPLVAERVIMAPTPSEAASIGRDKSLTLRSDWEQVKNQIMMEAVWGKFTQNEDIKDLLLSTGTSMLIEDAPNDYYWGVGKDGSGRNMLGHVLMQVRKELLLRGKDFFFEY
jgi:ribA/ribD-fused uncharacterized protein